MSKMQLRVLSKVNLDVPDHLLFNPPANVDTNHPGYIAVRKKLKLNRVSSYGDGAMTKREDQLQKASSDVHTFYRSVIRQMKCYWKARMAVVALNTQVHKDRQESIENDIHDDEVDRQQEAVDRANNAMKRLKLKRKLADVGSESDEEHGDDDEDAVDDGYDDDAVDGDDDDDDEAEWVPPALEANPAPVVSAPLVPPAPVVPPSAPVVLTASVPPTPASHVVHASTALGVSNVISAPSVARISPTSTISTSMSRLDFDEPMEEVYMTESEYKANRVAQQGREREVRAKQRSAKTE